ncbi:hypothetical protein J6590_051602 [Homalodisca vitripennis]|nr:hypothetical protein J6590_051602 [Homalodisca vitripennis]
MVKLNPPTKPEPTRPFHYGRWDSRQQSRASGDRQIALSGGSGSRQSLQSNRFSLLNCQTQSVRRRRH